MNDSPLALVPDREPDLQPQDQHEQGPSWPAGNVDLVTWYFDEAERLACDGEVERARLALQQLMSLQPDHGASHLLMARLCVVCQRWAEALASMEQAGRCGESVPEDLKRVAERRLEAEREELYAAPPAVRWYVGSHFEIRGRTLHIHGLDEEEQVDRVLRMVWKRFIEIDEVRILDANGKVHVRRERPVE